MNGYAELPETLADRGHASFGARRHLLTRFKWGRTVPPVQTPKEVGVPNAHRWAQARAMTTENKSTVKAFIDRLFTEGDVSVLDELAAPDYVNHDPPFGGTGTVCDVARHFTRSSDVLATAHPHTAAMTQGSGVDRRGPR